MVAFWGNQAAILEPSLVSTTTPHGKASRSLTCNQHRGHKTLPPDPEGRSGSHNLSLGIHSVEGHLRRRERHRKD